MVPDPPCSDSQLPAIRAAALTEARRRALSILHRDFPLAPALFAHYMWPLSESWTRSDRAGAGVRCKARVFLRGLERDGLVRRGRDASRAGYVLTDWGASATDPTPRWDRLV